MFRAIRYPWRSTDHLPTAAGFTLLELLVGLALLSLLTMTLYAGVRLGMRSWEAGEVRSEKSEEMRLVEGFLRRYLSGAYPLFLQEDNALRLQFEGSEQRLRFVAVMPAHLGVGGLYALTVELIGSDERARLVVTRTLAHPDVDPSAEAVTWVSHKAVLIDRLRSAQFAYFGLEQRASGREPDTPQWYDVWENTKLLPSLVRLQVIGEDGEPWPAIVVRLYLDEAVVLGGALHRSVSSAGPFTESLDGGKGSHHRFLDTP